MNACSRENTAVVLFSHGSLLCGADRAVRRHAERLASNGGFGAVGYGFLNYSRPLFEDTLAELLEPEGNAEAPAIRRVIVLPYFLVEGKFVTADLPPRIEAARSHFHKVEFLVADAMGDAPELANALLELASTARPPERWREDLDAAPRFCRADPECPLFGSPSCPGVPQPSTEDFDIGQTEGPPARSPESKTAESRALLILVHGSPRVESNAAVEQLANKLRKSANFAHVQTGFLECNQPDIPTAINQCANALSTFNATRKQIISVPHFLHPGNHVARDIPDLLEAAKSRHPHLEILMGGYVGQSAAITHLLARKADELCR